MRYRFGSVFFLCNILCFYNYLSNLITVNRNKTKHTMFTFKYNQHEFFISVEYYQGIITFKTDYEGEPIRERYEYFSEAEAKKRFRQYLRDITDNPTQNNIFIEQ